MARRHTGAGTWMALLSEMIRFDVVDDGKRRARLADLAVDLSEGEYPPVTHLLWQNPQKQILHLPWSAVQSVQWRNRRIRVPDLDAATPLPASAERELVLLAEDVLDALVLDLQRLRAVRANDLWLEKEAGGPGLSLQAADVELRAVLRRLAHGRWPGGSHKELRDWKYIEFLRGDPQAARAGKDYHRRIGRLPPGQIARLTDALPYLHAAELLGLLPAPVAAEVMEAMMPERQLQVFEELEADEGLRLLSLMRADIVADLLGRLEPAQARAWLERLPRRQRERVIQLLRYPEDTVGGVMTNDMVTLPAGMPAGEALRLLHRELAGPEFINFLHVIYVVQAKGNQRLLGMVGLRDLVVADPAVPVEQVMSLHLMTLDPLESAAVAARRVLDSGLAALPVISRDGELLGIVPMDNALTLTAPRSWRAEAPRLLP
jgi:magnesium transporter